ncbi:uncharacterized protein LOC134664758 [Cydia fagiglandana]|uniref:uncharacterized protein LOC134664758 n=1 Tax=Cydia fagiglandana TaxID=1458189 RepID=UPI002FEE3B3F
MGSTMIVVLLALVGLINAQHTPSMELRSELDLLEIYNSNVDSETSYRLTDSIQPSWVYVDMDVYLSESRFDGIVTHEVTISGDPHEEIVLHSNVVAITAVNILDSNNNAVALNLERPFELDNIYELLIINPASPVVAGEYTITIRYRGVINENQYERGFYKGYYFLNGVKREYATTQFQPFYARKAFPCFDEPQFKSKFVLSITRDAALSPSYSNMAINQTETVSEGRIKETFLPTPTISAYLIAFHVSDFVETTDGSQPDRPFGIISRPGVEAQHDYAHDIGVRITNEMNEYFNYDYYNMGEGEPMKNDHIAIPDFPAGAMENWGMVNYREAYLLYDPANTNIINKIFISTIMAHELAHKWFGNLVTCFWWSNLWLNESYASFFEYFSAHAADPSLELADQFIVDYVHSALNYDAFASATPMNLSTVTHNASISAHFSTASYAKGASVLRMMEHFVGPTVFRDALRTYLADNAYGLGTPEDMYDAFRSAVAADPTYAATYGTLDVGEVFDSWVQNPGSPVLNVDVNMNSGEITVTQSRFLIGNTVYNHQWLVPYTWTHSADPDFTTTKPASVLTTASTTENMPAGHNWVVFNIQQSGLYRVNYDDHNWEMLAAALRNNKDQFPRQNRAQFVNDVLHFVRAGESYITISRAFDVLSFLENEDDYLVWAGALGQLDIIRRRLEHIPAAKEQFEAYLLELMEYAIESLGYEEAATDSTTRILNRMQLLNYACNLGHEGCIADSLEKWNAFKANPTSSLVPVNARRYVYCVGLRHGDATDYNFLFDQYETSENAADMIVILRALGCTKDENRLQHYLQQSLTNDKIRYHDRTNAFAYALAGNRENYQTVVTFLQNNLADIRVLYGGVARLNVAINALVTYLTDFEDITSFQAWAYENQLALEDSFQTAKNVVATAVTNIQWGNSVVRDIYSFLRGRNAAGAITAPTFVALLLAAIMAHFIQMSFSYIALVLALIALVKGDHPVSLQRELDSVDLTSDVNRNDEQVYRLPESVIPLDLSDNRIRTNFLETPKMSSYLVTFLVSETFTVIAEDTSFTPSIRIIGRSNTVSLGDHALDLAVKMTTFFNDYFEIPYETMHLNLLNDHISSPDWASAGTENWGMVSYRELYLTLNSSESIMSNEHYAGTLVSHELAHKWFGNLITCFWWSNTWINEGFASYFGYIATNQMFPEYEYDDHFNSRYLQNSLAFDSGSTVALNHEVNTPAQVTGHFGTVSYSKGAAFLRMIHVMITPETFRKACRIFLTSNSFEATDQYDLYRAFEEAIQEDGTLNEYQGFNFEEFYRIWVNEPGTPILLVEINHETGAISLKQERFFLSATATPTGQIYPIPITYSTKSDLRFESLKPIQIMSGETLELTKTAGEEWVIFNNLQHGHYRVDYDEKSWSLIAEALLNEPENIHYLNRAQVVDDVFALMRSTRMSYSFGFNILRFLRNEHNMHVWDAAITGFNWLRNRLRHLPESQAEFDGFVLDTMSHLIEHVGFNVLSTDTPTDIMNRQATLHFACLLGHERCVTESRERFVSLKDHNVWVHGGIRRNVYVVGVREGDEQDFNFILSRFRSSNLAHDQLEMLRAMGATKNPALLTRYLELTLTDEVRSHDKANSFSYALLGNKENAPVILEFVKNNIDAMRIAIMSALKLVILPALLALAIAELPIDLLEVQETLYRNDDVDPTIYRIPEDFDPVHYDVEIIPYFEDEGDKEAFSFDGEVSLELKPIRDGLSSITLQENVRSIVSVDLFDSTGSPVELDQALPFERIREYHFLKINLRNNATLVNGDTYVVKIVYVGNINETPLSRGVFRGSYTGSDGRLHWYAATHLQPVNSRQVFPSFDEPGFKSTFRMMITRPTHFGETYSNMRIASTVALGNRIREVFHVTPRMPAYLVSFHVSEEFTVLADNNDRERPYRILGRPNAVGQGEYALEVGPPLTQWLEDYLGIEYYGMGEDMKNDQIAVPDWASGATENWGFVSYRELRLLYEEGETNALDKMYIGTITSHELAHKWFGNLVTCRWWDNVWINEGFASYFEYFAMDGVDPSMELADQFQIMYVQSALSADASAATRALQHTVNSPADVTGHFSGISYSKGATFLLMLKYLFTEETFKKALNYFLVDWSYEHAFPEHLYEAFTRAVQEDSTSVSNVNVEDFMKYWVDEPGYPVLDVEVNTDTGVISLSQERFFVSATATQTEQVWPLPLTWTTGSNPDFENLRPSRVMTGRTDTVQKTAGVEEWVIFNVQQKAGIYRVNYDTNNWQLLAAALKADINSIHYLNRAQIVDDVFSLMRSERMTYALGLQVLDFLKEETNYFVWYPAITGFSWLRNRLLHLPAMRETYDQLMYIFLDSVITDLGYDVLPSDSLTRTLNRFFVLSFACSIGHEGCVSNALDKWNAFRNNGVSVNPNIRRHVFCEGLRAGDYQDWSFLYQRRLSSNNQGDSVAMLRALGCTKDETAVKEMLERILTDDVKAQDRVNAFTFLYMGNRENANIALEFLKERIDDVRTATILPAWFNTVLANLAAYLNEEGLNDMEEWLHAHEASIPEYSVGISSIASARASMQWGSDRADNIISAVRGSAAIAVPSFLLLVATLLALLRN